MTRIIIAQSDLLTLLDLPSSISSISSAALLHDGSLRLDVGDAELPPGDLQAVYGPIFDEGVLNLSGFEPV